ncbi:uncharacterized protein LOC131332416 isoform X1 [Rhododendron vialii]|uniref:uncharacterized protein LOC131332416 isoform X1 n=1 Tax=Rhododendron vialii TaxID=182163 RepID=UPI00265D744F|nr:uncharacterized protein LOC131332416 isoform X1 [Rhododendron vialii]XP_058222604.1 uncharacterized protein LOC131332416 isoform X1 [Rhododendron vialii]XP_058222605.1 uncharacterized protein LOC131332416 isoform X1 [Rhododendron vialii]XP_058222606.1 uncharacterized protein LOC131332416 isoform X1 [Rhododendron vialii]XP_058222607.1 uncharacterized protein LOC131332416 isoform X1 [Rhododendron vialii]XP_058222608.1 uncharacterized protein LOC131332416 isoform X1 [Rhododendron vialii]XP_05
MANRLEQHPTQFGKYHAGCIWGFINFLDFGHRRSARRLLVDKRTTSRRNVGPGYYWSKLQKLTEPNGSSRVFFDGEGRKALIVDIMKTSIKELMEEEMLSEQEQNQQIIADIQTEEFDSESRGYGKKNCKIRSESSTSACDIHDELDAAGNFGSENHSHQESEEETNLDAKHDSNSDIQSEQAHSVFTGKLVDAIKVFVDQRMTVGNHLTKYETAERSNEFMNALQTLSTNKELILKLLKDPNSLLVKHIEDLEDAQPEEDQNPSFLSKDNLIDREVKVSKLSEPVERKQHNFFRRKSKSQEKILLKGHENCQTSNRIVILKPGPAIVHNQPEGKHSSLRSSHHKVQTERTASQFSFAKIKRKLKHAMGKERHGVPLDDRKVFYKHKNSGSRAKGDGEKVGWKSPNRNHFFNERFARLTIGTKNKEKSSKPDDAETSMGRRDMEYTKLKVYNNLYIEAKKHLSEMLSDGDEIGDFSNSQPPKTLGRIPSLSDYLSPDFVMAQKKLSHDNSVHVANEDSWKLTPDGDVSHLGPSRENFILRSCTTENPEYTLQSCNLNSDVLDELNHTNAVEAMCSMRPEKNFEADVEIVEISDASTQEESKVLDDTVEQSSSSDIRDEQDGDLTEAFDEDEYAQCLKSDLFDEGQSLSPPLTSAPSSSIINLVADLDISNERPERHSPVSVLEPLFTGDDISPTIIKSQPVELALQPREIIFDEQFSSATNQGSFLRSCLEDEESSFDYVEAVLLASGLNWEEFLSRWLSSDQILDAKLFDEVELFSNRSRQDQKLLFDCTNDILKVVCDRYFGNSPWVSFAKHIIHPIPRGKSFIHEVWNGVEWCIFSQPYSCTLDQIVGNDMSKAGTLMDLQFDVENIGIEIGEAIVKVLVDEIIWTFINEDPEIRSSVHPEDLIKIE